MARVLFAHERPGVSRAVEHVLSARGFEVHSVRDGGAALRALREPGFDALVTDVALPGVAGFELIEPAKAMAARAEGGARVVVLVASVFRKTSYKRRPARLYGADDYVELHHLGDMLPDKLAELLGIPADASLSFAASGAERVATQAVCDEADARMEGQDVGNLASLIVADLVLYNGDRIARTQTLQDARAALVDDLEIARDLMRQVRAVGPERSGDTKAASPRPEPPVTTDATDPIDAAFADLMRSLGRLEVAS